MLDINLFPLYGTSEEEINPKLLICAEEDTVPIGILSPPPPNPNDAADAEVIYPKFDIWVEPETSPDGIFCISSKLLPDINPNSAICTEDDTVPDGTVALISNPSAVIWAEDDTIPNGRSLIKPRLLICREDDITFAISGEVTYDEVIGLLKLYVYLEDRD